MKSPANLIDMTGRRFGMLTVLSRHGSTKKDNAMWLCRCDCGNEVTVMGTLLRRGNAISCGCQRPAQMDHAKEVMMTEKTIDGVQVPLIKKGY